jgi:hypothetical protein
MSVEIAKVVPAAGAISAPVVADPQFRAAGGAAVEETADQLELAHRGALGNLKPAPRSALSAEAGPRPGEGGRRPGPARR